MNKIQFSMKEEQARKSRGLASQTLKSKTVTGTLATWTKDGSSKTSNGSLGCWLVESGTEHWTNLSDIIKQLLLVPKENRAGWFEAGADADTFYIVLDTPKQLTLKFDGNGRLTAVTPVADTAAVQQPASLV